MKSKSTGCRKKSDALKVLSELFPLMLTDSIDPINPISLNHFKITYLAYAENIYSWNRVKSMKVSRKKTSEQL